MSPARARLDATSPPPPRLLLCWGVWVTSCDLSSLLSAISREITNGPTTANAHACAVTAVCTKALVADQVSPARARTHHIVAHLRVSEFIVSLAEIGGSRPDAYYKIILTGILNSSHPRSSSPPAWRFRRRSARPLLSFSPTLPVPFCALGLVCGCLR